MIVRNVENGKTADVPEVIGRHLVSTRDFVAEGPDEVASEVPPTPPPAKKKGRYRRRDMRAEP